MTHRFRLGASQSQATILIVPRGGKKFRAKTADSSMSLRNFLYLFRKTGENNGEAISGGIAFCVYLPAVFRHDPLCNGQSQTKAAGISTGRIGTVKAFENPFQLLLRNGGTRIGDRQNALILPVPFQPELNKPGGGILLRIVQQDPHKLSQMGSTATDLNSILDLAA